MGPLGSPFSKVGDRGHRQPLRRRQHADHDPHGRGRRSTQLGGSDEFVPGLHSTGDLSPDRRFIVHFPEERLIWSVGSGYGGNALLGKKCFALRIASTMARDQGWMAEHMLILGARAARTARRTTSRAAFPSRLRQDQPRHAGLALRARRATRCGRSATTSPGCAPGPDGRLWAVNPEAGFFGVVPGHRPGDEPQRDGDDHPRHDLHERRRHARRRARGGRARTSTPPARPHRLAGQALGPHRQGRASRTRASPRPRRQCPSMSPRWEDPQGVPLSAIIFGGRRARVAPLVFQSRDWDHGVFVGATMGSETTAAATGQVGVVRRDPMAMLPFCGYNMGDYFGHWLAMGRAVRTPPDDLPRELVPHRTPTGTSSGPASARTCACCCGWSTASRARGRRDETPIGLVPAPRRAEPRGPRPVFRGTRPAALPSIATSGPQRSPRSRRSSRSSAADCRAS